MALRDVRVAAVLCLLSLIATALSLVFAEFGAPPWVFVVLFAWLLTLGLPTLAAVLVLAGLWQGPSFGTYLVTVVILAFCLQLGAFWATRRGIERWRLRARR